MRLNKFIAANTAYSRRAADDLISQERITINGSSPSAGQQVKAGDKVLLDGKQIEVVEQKQIIIMLNKPRGYVCSRDGQGSKTVYELLPQEHQSLNMIGRLDKDSSGLLLFTNDGELANQLTHPKFQKMKVYEVALDKPLQPLHQQIIGDNGIQLEDGVSKFEIEKADTNLLVTLREGRNRQIRRTFEALGYTVNLLNRTVFGEYSLGNLPKSKTRVITS